MNCSCTYSMKKNRVQFHWIFLLFALSSDHVRCYLTLYNIVKLNTQQVFQKVLVVKRAHTNQTLSRLERKNRKKSDWIWKFSSIFIAAQQQRLLSKQQSMNWARKRKKKHNKSSMSTIRNIGKFDTKRQTEMQIGIIFFFSDIVHVVQERSKLTLLNK